MQLKDVKMMCEYSETEIEALQPGCGDLGPLSTPLILTTHIDNSFMSFYPDASILRIPPVEMLMLVRLRCLTADFSF